MLARGGGMEALGRVGGCMCGWLCCVSQGVQILRSAYGGMSPECVMGVCVRWVRMFLFVCVDMTSLCVFTDGICIV